MTFIWPKAVAAEEFAAKVMESRVAYLKATGAYTDAEAAAVEEFKAAFKSHSLAPGASVLFTHSPAGVLTVSTHPHRRTPDVIYPIRWIYIYLHMFQLICFIDRSRLPSPMTRRRRGPAASLP